MEPTLSSVSVALARPEEAYDGDLQPGDVEIRLRALGPFDRSGLDVVVEVRSKWFESRAIDRRWRADSLRAAVTAATRLGAVGVYLSRQWLRGRRALEHAGDDAVLRTSRSAGRLRVALRGRTSAR